jgi:hypothetical protein
VHVRRHGAGNRSSCSSVCTVDLVVSRCVFIKRGSVEASLGLMELLIR